MMNLNICIHAPMHTENEYIYLYVYAYIFVHLMPTNYKKVEMILRYNITHYTRTNAPKSVLTFFP
jgi:hypothetical protein